MKKLLLPISFIALCTLAANQSFAASVEINFDSVVAGSTANSAAPSGVTFYQAHYVNDLDTFGDEIPNTQKWQIDTFNDVSTPVTVDNPLSFNYGASDSGSNALNALWQPVLMHFDAAINLTEFSVVLDNSSYGDLTPSSLYFLDSNKNILGQLAFDQSVPGAVVTLTAPVNGVRNVLLASGAFYDTIQISSVPLPPTLALFLSGLVLFGIIKPRKAR
ncbi:MAG TPA: hypothetical protein VIZ65_14520 [Cellvibrionaceae bacterium]